MTTPNALSPLNLVSLIGTPNCPQIVDVRIDEDFDANPRLVPTAFRHSFQALEALNERLDFLDNRPTVVVCHKGKKLSQGVAAWLRSKGRTAHYLSGGAVSWAATANAPSIDFSALPKPLPSYWIAPDIPTTEEFAAMWFLRRFIDPKAQFLFVQPQEIANVADRFGYAELIAFTEICDKIGLRSQKLTKVSQEFSTLSKLLKGVCALHTLEGQRLDAALLIFDAHYSAANPNRLTDEG